MMVAGKIAKTFENLCNPKNNLENYEKWRIYSNVDFVIKDIVMNLTDP